MYRKNPRKLRMKKVAAKDCHSTYCRYFLTTLPMIFNKVFSMSLRFTEQLVLETPLSR